MSRFGRCLASLSRTALAAMIAVSVIGCQSGNTTAKEEMLPPGKLEMLNSGDKLINEGEDLKDQAKKLQAEGKDGAELARQGDAKIAEGEAIKKKAMSMKQ
ncbi:hypothetical protein [Humisphaera borealis]|uniref:Lipoprotein n=1 Tax=Humisphaera borealis TaxID=2807512 RepID=A0A7M2WU92_9BACT|nr:hypothetical protein [Humisphaera borealis]QOV89095.1 hypothetical protein IPV69_23210 [Humisphaera borealis]